MANIHTDFISMPKEVFEILLDVLSDYDGVLVDTDVSLFEQYSLERRLTSTGFHILKLQYVK